MSNTEVSRLNRKYVIDMEYVRAVFEESGLSYKSIAGSQGIADTTVYRFFNGQKSPDFNTVCCIIGAIGASLDRAVGIVNDPADDVTPLLSPDPAAVVYEAVLQNMPSLVDEQKIADQVADSIKETVVDEQKIADHVAGQVAGQVADAIKETVVDGQKIADQVAGAIKETVVDEQKIADHVAGQVAGQVANAIPDPVNPEDVARAVLAALPPYPQPLSAAQIAKAVVDALPAAPVRDCDSCRSARAYETIISTQNRVICGFAVVFAVMTIFLMFLLLV